MWRCHTNQFGSGLPLAEAIVKVAEWSAARHTGAALAVTLLDDADDIEQRVTRLAQEDRTLSMGLSAWSAALIGLFAVVLTAVSFVPAVQTQAVASPTPEAISQEAGWQVRKELVTELGDDAKQPSDELPVVEPATETLSAAASDVGKENVAWGKAVEGVKARLQPGVFRNGYQWLSFDLRNESREQSVHLGPGGMPTSILIDNVLYKSWEKSVRQLPVCKPGQRITDCIFKLDEKWMAVDPQNEWMSIDQPSSSFSFGNSSKMLELKPGKHTVQAMVYAIGPGDIPTSHRLTRVLSNPVEIEIVAEDAGEGHRRGKQGQHRRRSAPSATPGQKQPQVSPSGAYSVEMPIGKSNKQVDYPVWTPTIKNAKGRVVYKDTASTLSGYHNSYWDWSTAAFPRICIPFSLNFFPAGKSGSVFGGRDAEELEDTALQGG